MEMYSSCASRQIFVTGAIAMISLLLIYFTMAPGQGQFDSCSRVSLGSTLYFQERAHFDAKRSD
eukprot:1793857-Amphidinium_carterae.1